ncbi:hypothetical protein OHB13_12015 [Streptomyces sp. NBC_00440]|uniref:hypothetical protein n=1 Tax=Streptomyces sp. NBC_00440 TaxID=2975741 RepID=UPI002E1BD22A
MQNLRRALVSAITATVALVGCSIHGHKPEAKPTSVVAPFNDGFADSKQDDCEQGFQPACVWLSRNR